MNQQDKSFMITFTTVISVLVLIAVALFLAARMVSLVSVKTDDTSRKQLTAEDRIKPVGKVAVASASAPQAAQGAATAPAAAPQAAAAKQPGEDTYNTACAACHGAGVLGAPKLGAKEDWEPRFAQGLDTLVNHAINGIRAMPPKGGNPALSEQEVKDAVTYMLKGSSIEVGGGTPAVAAAPAAAPAKPADGADLNKGKEVYASACFACHTTGVAGAPKIDDKAAWEARAKQGIDTLVSHAVNGIRAMPPKGGNPALSEADIRNSVAYMLSQAGIEATPAPVAATPAPAQPPAALAPVTPPAAAPAAPAQAHAAPAPAPAPSEAASAAQQSALAAAQKAAGAAQEAASAAQEAAAAAKEAIATTREAMTAVKEAAAAARQAAAAAQAAVSREAAPAKHPALPPAEGSKPAPESSVPPAKETPPAHGKDPESAPAKKSMFPPSEENKPAPDPQQANAAIVLPNEIDLARGRQLYKTACIVCHQTGAGGAPKLEDKAAWSPRLAQGFDTLVAHSLGSYKSMLADVANQDIVSAVGYMVSVVQ